MATTRIPLTTTCYLTRDDFEGLTVVESDADQIWLELEFLSNYYSSNKPPEFKLVACTEATEVNDAIKDANSRLESLWTENKELKKENQNVRAQLEDVRGFLRLAGRGIVLP